MGGSVGVISAVGEGAEFWLELESAHPPCVNVAQIKNLASFWHDPSSRGAMAVAAT